MRSFGRLIGGSVHRSEAWVGMPTDLFYGTSGPSNAEIMVVGEAWGATESQLLRPFVGESGREFDKMLEQAGIQRRDVFCTNVVSKQPANNDFRNFLWPTKDAKANGVFPTNGLYLRKIAEEGLETLYRQVETVSPRLIIAAGNYPLWAFSDSVRIANSNNPSGYKIPAGIMLFRGSQLYTTRGNVKGIPLLPLIHPASVMRNWPQRPTVVHDLRKRVPLAIQDRWEKPKYPVEAPLSYVDALNYLDGHYRMVLEGLKVSLSVDLETSHRTIACLGFTSDGVNAACIPFLRPGNPPTSFWDFPQEVELVKRIRRLFNHPNCLLIGQNFLYDAQYMSRWWRTIPRVHFDTMVAQHVLLPGTPKPLWHLSSLYCAHHAFWKDDLKEWADSDNFEQNLLYNCEDVLRTWEVWQTQKELIARGGLSGQFELKMREWYLAFRMMDRGIAIDKKVRDEMTIQVADAAHERKAWLNTIIQPWMRPPAGRTAKPWYQSPKQQQALFYQVMGLKSIAHRKTGNPTVNDEALNEIKLRYPELTRLVDTIAELRSLGVFQNTFLNAAIDPDGRMRCSFNIATPETFRWSSSENAFGRGTNLQNIPKGDE